MPTHHGTLNLTAPSLLVILLAIGVAIVYVRVVIFFINDLYKPERVVVGFSKDIWAVIIVLGSIAGIAAYLLYGRVDS